MGFDSSLRRKVRQLAREKRSEIKEEDIYSSNHLLRYLNGLALTILKKNDLDISVFGDEDCGITAMTDKKAMLINYANGIIRYFPELEQRFVCFMGMFFHELAHVLFCDFNADSKAMRYIAEGHFYGQTPTGMNAEEEAAWTEMETALQNPLARKIFIDLFDDYSNIIDDRHDEDSIMDLYGSFVEEGIFLARDSLHSGSRLFEKLNEDVLSGKLTDLTVMQNLLLQYTRFGFVFCEDQSNLDNSPIGKMLEKIKPHADVACATDDVTRKHTEIHWILLCIWPLIRAEIQKMQDQQGQNQQGQGQQEQQSQNQQSSQGQNLQGSQVQSQQGFQGQSQQNSQGQSQQGSQEQSQQGSQGQSSGSGSSTSIGEMLNKLTAEQVQNILNQLSSASQSMKQQPNPTQMHSSQTAIDRRTAEKNGQQREHKESQGVGTASGSDQLSQALSQIMAGVAESHAESDMEQQASGMMKQRIESCSQTSPHKGIPLTYERPLAVTDSDRATYNAIMRDLLPISKRLQRQIMDALRDLKEGYVQKHRLYGKDLVAGDTYRPDGRFFSSKKLPQDLPDMAISILVDESGSMSSSASCGETRISMARKAAMLLYDFATGVNIPVSVAGHHAGSGVTYELYTDFDRVNDNDKYRLSKMHTAGCNRDGMALNIAAGLLEQRPEEVKLLIIISDGWPNHSGYSGDAAKEDIREICRSCRRKGIEVIAAAIGDDRKVIQEIYQDQFLDISDLSKLPKIFVDLVKKRILRNAL